MTTEVKAALIQFMNVLRKHGNDVKWVVIEQRPEGAGSTVRVTMNEKHDDFSLQVNRETREEAVDEIARRLQFVFFGDGSKKPVYPSKLTEEQKQILFDGLYQIGDEGEVTYTNLHGTIQAEVRFRCFWGKGEELAKQIIELAEKLKQAGVVVA